MAETLGVSPRSVQNWIAAFKGGRNAKVGRPFYTGKQRRHAMWMVARELRKQGYPGWRPIDTALGNVQTRLIQEYVRLFKAKRKKRMSVTRKIHRKSTTVLMKNAYWTQDGTHVGRIEKVSVESQIIKDRGSLKTLGIKTGVAANADDVMTFFDKAKECRGLPLVIGTDNGSAYCNEEVSDYLHKEKVVHLLSLPRTPEHNGSAEIGIRELKDDAMLGKGVVLECLSSPHAVLAQSASRINMRLRGSKKFKSANDLDDTLLDARNMIDRDVFYNECHVGLTELRGCHLNGRELRIRERELILKTLEKYGAIQQTRGDRIYGEKQEVIL